MSIKSNEVNEIEIDSNQDFIVTSNWSPPIEAFVESKSYLDVIEAVDPCDIRQKIKSYNPVLDNDEIVLVHETTKNAANNIDNIGFRTQSDSVSEIRSNAVFGWPHHKDVGKMDIDGQRKLVIIAADSTKTHVSSYTTSARQLIEGRISPKEYERKHTMTVDEYVSLIESKDAILNHTGYSEEELNPNKVSATEK